jgi:hypothetical protein
MGGLNAYESSPFQPWNGPLALLKNTATKSLQSQTGPVFAWGYWSAIYVREGDAWKIRIGLCQLIDDTLRRSMPPKGTAVLSSEPTAAGQLEQVATAVENVEIANPKRLQLC